MDTISYPVGTDPGGPRLGLAPVVDRLLAAVGLAILIDCDTHTLAMHQRGNRCLRSEVERRTMQMRCEEESRLAAWKAMSTDWFRLHIGSEMRGRQGDKSVE